MRTEHTPVRRWLWPAGIVALALSVALLPSGEPVSGRPAAVEEEGPVRFTEFLIQDGYGYAYGVAAADLDGDGHLDLTSSDTTGDNLYWFAGDGKGGFTRHFVQKGETGWFERHAIGDVDGDGKPDVVVVKNQASEIVWFQNGGKPRADAAWKRHVIAKGFTRAYDVALADFNGDGKLDVAGSCWVGNAFAWFENPGKPEAGKEWVKHAIDTNVSETRTVRAADFNGDGKIDLLGTASASNLVVWYENPGAPDRPWKRHVIDDRSPRPIHGQAVDLDGDGDLDVVMALGMRAPPGEKNTHQVVWYENVGMPGRGTEWKKHVIGELEEAFEAIAVDLNGDGHLDVVATAWGGKGCLVWFENPGDPRKVPWKKHVLKKTWVNANQVIAADLNGDGRPDLIATAERGANELRWWRNDGPRAPR
jgi:hypothetical protein